MKIVYVTGNSYKIELATKNLGLMELKLFKKIDCPEIQYDKIENVSKFSAKYAANFLNMPVIKNDSGLCIDSLKGFPGPYTLYVEDTLSEDRILKLMEGIQSRKAFFVKDYLIKK